MRLIIVTAAIYIFLISGGHAINNQKDNNNSSLHQSPTTSRSNILVLKEVLGEDEEDGEKGRLLEEKIKQTEEEKEDGEEGDESSGSGISTPELTHQGGTSAQGKTSLNDAVLPHLPLNNDTVSDDASDENTKPAASQDSFKIEVLPNLPVNNNTDTGDSDDDQETKSAALLMSNSDREDEEDDEEEAENVDSSKSSTKTQAINMQTPKLLRDHRPLEVLKSPAVVSSQTDYNTTFNILDKSFGSWKAPKNNTAIHTKIVSNSLAYKNKSLSVAKKLNSTNAQNTTKKLTKTKVSNSSGSTLAYQKPLSVSATAANFTKTNRTISNQVRANSKPYVIITADNEYNTKKARMNNNNTNTLPWRQNFTMTQSLSDKQNLLATGEKNNVLSQQNNRTVLQVVPPTSRQMHNTSTSDAEYLEAPPSYAYGPWKTVDVTEALINQHNSTTVDTNLMHKQVTRTSNSAGQQKGGKHVDQESLALKLGKNMQLKKIKRKKKAESKKRNKKKIAKNEKGKHQKVKKEKKKNKNTKKKNRGIGKKNKKVYAKKQWQKSQKKHQNSKKKSNSNLSEDDDELPKIPESDYKEKPKTDKSGDENKENSSSDHEGNKDDKKEKEKESSKNDNDNNTDNGDGGKVSIGNEEKLKSEENDESNKNGKNKDKENKENKESTKGESNEKEKNKDKEIEENKESTKGESNEKEKNKESANDTGDKESSKQSKEKADQNKERPGSKDGKVKVAPETVKDEEKQKEKENKGGMKNAGKNGNETEANNGGKTGSEENKDGGKNEKENKGQDKTENKEEGKVSVSTESKNKKQQEEKESKTKETHQQTIDTADVNKKTPKDQDEKTKNLQKTLSKLRFMNGASGKVYTGQQFSYISQCGLYTEPQNVSQIQHSWVTKTYSPYFYLYEKPKDYEKCKPSDWMYGKDMRGSVFLSFEVKSLHGSNLTNNAKICEKYCCKEPRCEAWVIRFQDSSTTNCPEKSFCCWLKNDIPPVEDYYLEGASIAGVVHRKHHRHPPVGMRSAVPLGGLGAGSFEMRADGTFHEWTIENQSPGGSAKLGKTALEKLFLGVRVQKGDDEAKAAILKTHTPKGFENETVKSLEYFGAHPVSKFAIELSEKYKDDVQLNMYAFSPFHPRDAIESATPAVSFTLEITNPSEKEDLDVSFMMNLPFGYNEDTVRKGGNYQEATFSRFVTPKDCMRECVKRPDCKSWTTNGPFTCMLKDSIPLHSYDYGIVSGIRGDWQVKDGLLNCQRPGFAPQSGDVSLYPLETGSETMSYLVTDEAEHAWKNFKRFGSVNGNESHTMKLNQSGLHGSVSVNTKLKPKETKLLSIVFSWYFPNKDIADERVGNFYTNLFKDSAHAAKHFEEDLLSSASDVLKWQSSVFTPTTVKASHGSEDDEENSANRSSPTSTNCSTKVNGVSTLPVCLQDILVNSMSFLRTAMWFENGRWRQWEAFDCANLDPVHIDFHRIIPYMIFYPDLVKQIMFSWADHQMTNIDNGMIQESLSQGCLEETTRDGNAGGRPMTDVNVAFIAQAYLVYSWTNDTEFFDQIYPYAARAMHWLIHKSTKGSGLPHRKADTYDLFELEKYDHCAYNSIMYLLALRLMQKMAALQNDKKTMVDVGGALERADKLFDVEMWDQKKGFYHAWFDDEWGSPAWLMTDIFYGQVWSYTLGMGDLVDRDKIKKHLKKEEKRNDSPFGLKVLTKSDEPTETEDTSIILGDDSNSCKSLENITKTDSIWMSSSTDWSTLQLHLGMPADKAMEQAIKSLDNYRSTLRDQWNFHGITSSSHYGLDGLPWATSHYTLHLVMWHLPLALSGQQYYAPDGTLKFDPKYSPPYWLPFYTPYCMGNIEAKESGEESDKKSEIMYTFTVSSGRCQLKELSISKSKYSGAVDLSEGDSLTWSTPKLSQADRIKAMLDQLKKH